MLAEDTISRQELEHLCQWILAGNRLTKSNQTLEFEREFSEWIGSKHAIFTNSGSSSNLLMIASLKESGRLRNNKVVAASVSWVTTVAPLLQLGFDVTLCDCDKENLGLDLMQFEKICEKEKPSVVVLCHVLGHANSINEIMEICDRHNVLIVEDSCEALGSVYEDKKLGTLGVTGSFSFYYGHHISTIEGGMVVTDDTDLNQVMLSLRSHGWSRDLSLERRNQLTAEYEVDEFRNLYTFYYPGYNLRSTDLQAFLGRSQLQKLNEIVAARQKNFNTYAELLPEYFCQSSDTTILSSFAYGTYVKNRLEVFNALKSASVECRPLICGNIAKHPFWLNSQGPLVLPNADKVHDYGIYLPNHHNIALDDIERVAEVFAKVAIAA